MPKIRKKIDLVNYHRFKKDIEENYQKVEEEYNQLAKQNGWKDGKARTYAMMKNYISYIKKERLEYEGD